MIKVKFSGASQLEEEINKRLKNIRRNQDVIFGKPLEPVLSEIKNNLLRDTLNEGNYSHINTGNLLSNTRYELTGQPITDGFSVKVSFGYFVPYGLNLEQGSSTDTAALTTLRSWVDAKFSSTPSNTTKIASAVNRSLKKEGADAYPIIQPVWEKMRDGYFDRVAEELRKQWQ